MIKLNPLVSVISISYNSALTISDCINSVFNQSYSNIEHIVVDGGSTDDTVEIIKARLPRGGFFLSEKDGGIYSAMNKGLSLASGDYIYMLNSDNLFHDSDSLLKLVNCANKTGAAITYGDAEIVSTLDTNKVKRYWRSGLCSLDAFRCGWMPPHQAVLIHKDVHEKIGNYNENFRISADYELLFRALIVNNYNFAYVPQVVVRARDGGISNSSIKNIIISNIEVRRAWVQNGFKPPILLPILKPLRKIIQKIARKGME